MQKILHVFCYILYIVLRSILFSVYYFFENFQLSVLDWDTWSAFGDTEPREVPMEDIPDHQEESGESIHSIYNIYIYLAEQHV